MRPIILLYPAFVDTLSASSRSTITPMEIAFYRLAHIPPVCDVLVPSIILLLPYLLYLHHYDRIGNYAVHQCAHIVYFDSGTSTTLSNTQWYRGIHFTL